MENIQIKTGANLSRLLQSTVNIPQAFTELIKNSIQNFATFCDIELLADSAIITDDGQGFDHNKDEQGMNAFEKYFVFGNSYDLTGGQGVRLGQMGIGGKLANDKLSHETNIHWKIETKNTSGHCFIVEYKPDGNQFLNDYHPSLTEISPEECSIKTQSGTKVTIVNLKQNIQNNGWPMDAIKNELSTFFGYLLPQLEKEGKKFQIFLNGNSLDFSYKLPGSNIPIIKRTFEYDYYGETKTSNVELRLSLIYDRRLIKNHPLKNIDIISKVKVCPFYLSDNDLIEETLSLLESKSKSEIEGREKIHNIFSKLIGFISCDDLSDVLDDTDMPAKDLSHHGLRNDHPITLPFYRCIYRVILEWIVEYIKLNTEEKIDILDALASEVSSMLADYFDDESFSDLWDDDQGQEEDEEEEEEEIDKDSEEIKSFAKYAAEKQWSFEPEELEGEPDDPEPEPPIQNKAPWWNRFRNQNKSKSKRIRYTILDFGQEEMKLMSKVDDSTSFNVMINSGNPKFQRFSKESSPFLLSLHISELLIREIIIYKNPFAKPSDVDESISDFYNDKYQQIKNKSA